MKDRLGSIRVTVDEAGDIVSYDDYDPWGMILTGRSGNEGFANDKYKFAGKERDVETGYDYFACPPKSEGRRRGARYYDSELGRWLSTDPLADSYPSWSSYSYAGNNPLNAIDPDGMEWVYIFGYGWVWELPEVVVTAPAWWREVANEKLDRFSAEFNTAQVIPFPLNPVAPPIVGPMESPGKTGKGILELFDKMSELDAQYKALILITAVYITDLVVPTNLEVRKSGKEKASDIPSWAEGTKPIPGESGKEYAKRLCDGKCGPGNYDTGPGSEYNNLKKYGDRSRK